MDYSQIINRTSRYFGRLFEFIYIGRINAKGILIALLCMGSIVDLEAQDENANDVHIFIINSMNPKVHYGGVDIIFSNQRLIKIYGRDALKYKLHSRGEILITTGTTNQHKLFVEDEVDYYLRYEYDRKSKAWKFTEIDKSEYETHFVDYPKNRIIQHEESLEIPINRASIAEHEKKRSGPSQGTGFLLNKDGYILTNFHVIDKAKKITVKGVGGDHSIGFEAQVVGTDSRTDLALLRITSKLVTFEDPPYAFVPSKTVQQGEAVVALGYPIRQVMGEEMKVTNGIINAKSGYKGAISEFQFSAAVQPGNSGGPLLNGQGQVVGMVTAKLNPEVTESVGYAVKSDHLMFFLDQFEGVNYRRAEASDAAPTLPQVVSASAPFVFVIETE